MIRVLEITIPKMFPPVLGPIALRENRVFSIFCIAWRSLGACFAKKDTPKAAPIIPPRAPQATVIAAVTFLLTGVNMFTTLQTTYANVANKAALAIPQTSLANHFPFESALFVGELRQYADKL